MKMRMLLMVLILSAATAFDAVAAMYDTTAAIFVSEEWKDYSNNGSGGGIGFVFTPKTDIAANQLGLFDGGHDGFWMLDNETATHFVGIYTCGGDYIASATISTETAEYDDFFWYASIDEGLVTFEADTPYMLLAEAGNEKYVTEEALSSIRTDIRMNGVAYSYVAPSTAAFFDDDIEIVDSESRGYFGPNFRYVAPVPEPGTVLLLGSGLFLIGAISIIRKRRHARSI